MIKIEENISQYIKNQFPAFYKEEGPNFIAFVEAYYEWLETHHQYLTLEDASDFSIGDTVTQGNSEGIIVTKDNNNVIVRVISDDQFRCKSRCNDLTPLVSESGKTTFIVSFRNPSTIFLSRKLNSYRDIDSTIESFIIGFKEKYLKNIIFDTETNKKLLVKNSLSLYRSKGSERAIDLFFRLVYGTKADTYVPGRDIFKLSDGQWTRPQYLEVSQTIKNIQFVGKKIVGVLSGATAFVESFIKRRVTNDYVSLLYISNIVGNFRNNEPLVIEGQLPEKDNPRVLGSITRFEVISPGTSFSIGDIVSIISEKGGNAKARVTAVDNSTGIVDFQLLDGGWGYTVSAESIVSEKVIGLENVSVSNTDKNSYFEYFETIFQPIANLSYTSASFTGEILGFTGGEQIYFANSTDGAIGNGIVLIVENEQSGPVLTGNGFVRVCVTSNSVSNIVSDAAKIISVSNTNSNANIVDIADWTVSGQVMGVPKQYTLRVDSRTENFALGENIFQSNGERYASGRVISTIESGSTQFITIENASGVFTVGQRISTVANTKSANVQEVSMTIGVHNITGANSGTSFILDYNTILNSFNTLTANIETLSQGTGAEFQIGNVSDTETIFINTDLISANNQGYYAANGEYQPVSNFASLPLNNYGYGFPKNPQANSSSLLLATLNFDQFIIGSISSLSDINPGQNYDANPYVLARQPYISAFNRKDFIIDVDSSLGYNIGERILQSNISIVSQLLQISNTIGFSVGDVVYQGANYSTADAEAIISSVANGTHLVVTEASNIFSVSVDLKNIQYSLNTITYDSLVGSIPSNSAIYSANSTDILGSGIVFYNNDIDTMIIGITSGTFSNGELLYLHSNNSNFANIVSNIETYPNTESVSNSSILVTAKGILKSIQGNTLRVKRTTFGNFFKPGEMLIGQSTGKTSNIISVIEDSNTLPIGFNATIDANVITSNGAISSLSVEDSGFGYSNGQILTFTSEDKKRSGSARIIKSGHGTSTGYFKTTRGFLSSDKFLHDSDFYQEYSYQVLTRIPFDTYQQMFKDVLHLSGTKLFGSVILESLISKDPYNIYSNIEQSED